MSKAPQNSDYYRKIANKIKSGVDKWLPVYVDGHQVVTTTIFIRDYGDHLVEWVRDFLEKKSKIYDFGREVVVDPADRWEKEFEGETIYQFITSRRACCCD